MIFFSFFQMIMSNPIRQIQTLGPDDYEPPPTPCAGYRHKKFGAGKKHKELSRSGWVLLSVRLLNFSFGCTKLVIPKGKNQLTLRKL